MHSISSNSSGEAMSAEGRPVEDQAAVVRRLRRENRAKRCSLRTQSNNAGARPSRGARRPQSLVTSARILRSRRLPPFHRHFSLRSSNHVAPMAFPADELRSAAKKGRRSAAEATGVSVAGIARSHGGYSGAEQPARRAADDLPGL